MTETKVEYRANPKYKTCGICLHFPVCMIRYNTIVAGMSNLVQPNEAIESVQRTIAEHCQHFLPSQNENMKSFIRLIGDEGRCKGCGVLIYWVKHKNGKAAPYTAEGLNHFVDCPAAKEFRK